MSEKQLPAEANAEVPYVEGWRRLWWLPCELSLEVALARFTVRKLLRLEPGSIVASAWSHSAEIPLYAGGQRIGWAELDAVNEHIGARITELL